MEIGNNKVSPMAISECKTELTMSFEFATENDESLFFLMQRPKSELFGAFISRFERNISKRWKKISMIFALHTATQILDQEAVSSMMINDVLTSGNKLVISGRIYHIQYQSPKVVKFSFPKRIFVDHYILPKLVVENGRCEDCQFSWFRRSYDFKKKCSTSPWVRLACGDYALKLSSEDAEHQFKLEIEPRRDNVIGVCSVHYTTSPPEPLNCDLNYLSRCKFTTDATLANQFRIVSYNLLAEMYTDTKESKDMFAYCVKDYLEFSYRKAVLCNEILSYNADIYLFQEVDSSFYNSLSLTLKPFNSSYVSKKDIREGCAIFYRASKFKFVDSFKYSLSDLLQEPASDGLRTALQSNTELYTQLEKLPNALMVTILEEQSTNRKWIVANTHLFAGETADTIRFIQSFLCFTHLQSLVSTFDDCSLIFGGDFNSTPDTCVLEIMRNNIQLGRFEEYSGKSFEFELALKLQSACGLPEYTNYTRNFVGCLDYIFYDDRKLRVTDVVPFPSHEQVIESEAIPSQKFPSDHIPLICTLEYRN